MTAAAPAPPPPEPAPDADPPGEQAAPRASRIVGLARDTIETVYAARLAPPPAPTPAARAAYGAGLPLAVLGAVLADPAARRRYLRVCAAQAAVVLALGLLLGVLWRERGLAFWSSLFWSSLYATLCAVEWAVIALSRQHHDAISRDAALLTGVPPEDPELTPRVCLDVRWMMTRARRYFRGWKLLIAGLPALALLYLVPWIGGALYTVAGALWATYWLVVLVAAKSAHAWKEEGSAPDPWFVRGWDFLTTRVPGFRWWLPRLYGRLLRRMSFAVFSPAARFERSPWELAGVAVARVIGGLPGCYLFLRPLIPVAAQHVLMAQDRRPPSG